MSELHCKYRFVQDVAKQVLREIAETVSSESTEQSIASTAASLLAGHGVVETWYHDCMALALAGSRSCLSESGRDYQPSDELVGQTNLITIDLSPRFDGCWGDCARSFIVENGRVVTEPTLPEFRVGVEAIRKLHASVRSFVAPDTLFSQLFRFANEQIDASGFESLDFLKNVGHSIASCLEDRAFINGDSELTLGSVEYFTFEPHVRLRGGEWGFKHEEVFFFDEQGRAQVL